MALVTLTPFLGIACVGFILFGVDYTGAIDVTRDYGGGLVDQIIGWFALLAYHITSPIRHILDVPQTGASGKTILSISAVIYFGLGIPLAVFLTRDKLKAFWSGKGKK